MSAREPAAPVSGVALAAAASDVGGQLPTAPAPSRGRPPAPHVRGWLLIFVVWAGLTVVGSLWSCGASATVAGGGQTAAFFPAIFQGALDLAWLAAALVGLRHVLRRSTSARRYWMAALACYVPAQVWGLALAYGMSSAAGRDLAPEASRTAVRYVVFRMAAAGLWFAYWGVSGRVRAAFTVAAVADT
jgi:hypothetical protein